MVPNQQTPANDFFDGEFTTEIQNRLRRKRLELGLSYSDLGAFFNVHWTTIRKWEGSAVHRCHPLHRSMIQRFLSGGCDHMFNLAERRITRHTLALQQAEYQSRNCIVQLSSCCRMLRARPELLTVLMDSIMAAANSTLRQYSASASPGKGSPAAYSNPSSRF